MQVSVDIRRSDLIKFNLFLLPRARGNLIFVAVLAIGMFIYTLVKVRPSGVADIAVAAVTSTLSGVGALLAGFAVSLAYILLTSSTINGVLGEHTYQITPEGLRESTSSNEGLQKWVGVHAVDKSSGFIFIRISGYLFHLIPRRAFGSQQEFESFFVSARNLWKKAAQPTVQTVRSQE